MPPRARSHSPSRRRLALALQAGEPGLPGGAFELAVQECRAEAEAAGAQAQGGGGRELRQRRLARWSETELFQLALPAGFLEAAARRGLEPGCAERGFTFQLQVRRQLQPVLAALAAQVQLQLAQTPLGALQAVELQPGFEGIAGLAAQAGFQTQFPGLQASGQGEPVAAGAAVCQGGGEGAAQLQPGFQVAAQLPG